MYCLKNMNIRVLLLSSLLLTLHIKAQSVSTIYKIDDLRKRINANDSLQVVNFWATWCKPCILELPAFDSLAMVNPKIKVLLVCLDFKEDLNKKVNPFLKKNNIKSECVLLDEVNGNDFVNKISPTWSGAIPTTLFKKNKIENLIEKKMKLAELQVYVGSL
jgi:thiol-disulfide isomerase/thioredoxin